MKVNHNEKHTCPISMPALFFNDQSKIKTRQLFRQPSTKKTLLVSFLSKVLRVYFGSSRQKDFTSADNYYDLWLRSKTNLWGHAGTTEYALERSIPPLRHKKKPGRTSNSPPTSIEQYRDNVDLSGHVGFIGGRVSVSISEIKRLARGEPEGGAGSY
ncbi:hypothetical protein QYF36_023700 [Acer negundo]|nr:hypothetical protein QYF36_023700 [Acer negundo]